MSDSTNPRFTDEELTQLRKFLKSGQKVTNFFNTYEENLKNANLPDDFPSYPFLFFTEYLSDFNQFDNDIKNLLWFFYNNTELAERSTKIVPPSVVIPDVCYIKRAINDGVVYKLECIVDMIFKEHFEEFIEFVSSRVNVDWSNRMSVLFQAFFEEFKGLYSGSQQSIVPPTRESLRLYKMYENLDIL